MYIHKQSNHPPHVAKQLPVGIGKRLSEISSDVESLNSFKGDYEQALRTSGHRAKLEFTTPQTAKESHKKQRKRHIIWFTPPYSRSLKTNLGKEFLSLIDKNFPIRNPLHEKYPFYSILSFRNS